MNNYKFCFIFGPGRCGIKLFLSLFDNHREIVVLPFTIKFYQIFKNDQYKLNYNDLLKIFEKKTRFRILKELANDIHHSLGNVETSKYDHKIFCKELKKLMLNKNTISRREIIEYFYISYAQAIKKDLKKIKYIIVDAVYHDHLNEINYDFENYKSFFLLRDPREQLLSFLKLHHKTNTSLYIINRMNYLTHSIFAQKENYCLLEKLQNDNYEHLIVKFENLKKNPIKTMQNAAEFLAIDFNEELKKPTFLGKLAIFDSSFSSRPIVGFGEDNTSRLGNYFNKLQIIQSDFIFSYYLKKYNYSLVKYKKNFLIKLLMYIHPFKYEILPSADIFKNNLKIQKYKNTFIYKMLKYIYFFSFNIFFYFINRFVTFSYLKLFRNDK